MRLNDIIKAISTCEIIGGADIDVTGIQMDSRLVEEGNMFVAVKGTQTDGTRAQGDQRVDGVARQHTADDIGHCAHRKACAGAEDHCRQQHRQTAQIEPDEAGGNAQYPAEHDAHGYQQSQHGQGTHRSFFVVHRSCPP